MQEFIGFFSYSHHDAETRPEFVEAFSTDLARLVEGRLINASFSVWKDTRDLRVGARWDRRIQEAVRASHLLIVLLSPKWLGSDYCRKEFNAFVADVESKYPEREYVFTILARGVETQARFFTPEQSRVYDALLERQFQKALTTDFIALSRDERHSLLEKIADEVAAMITRLREFLPAAATGARVVVESSPPAPQNSDSRAERLGSSPGRPQNDQGTQTDAGAAHPAFDELDIETIKERMVALIVRSPSAVDGLRNALELGENEGAPLEARACEAISALVERPYKAGVTLLVKLKEALASDAQRVVCELAHDYACVIVAPEDMAALRAQRCAGNLGSFLTLPATNETLVEILLARHAGKRPEFARDGKPWPRGVRAIPCPPPRNDPFSDSEIHTAFLHFMEDKYLSEGDKRMLSPEDKRSICNEMHALELEVDRRRRYFLLDELPDHRLALDRLRADWPTIDFIQRTAASDSKRYVPLHLLKDLFQRKGDDEP